MTETLRLKEITLPQTIELIKRMGTSKYFGHDQLDSWSLKLVNILY